MLVSPLVRFDAYPNQRFLVAVFIWFPYGLRRRKVPVSPFHVFQAEFSLACTYAMRRPELARECARTALVAAIRMGRPDLAYRVNSLLGVL